MMKKLLIPILLTSTAIAAQCPSIKQVLVNDQWQTPTGWQTLPLSPLAGDTGKQQFSVQGLTHVFYLTGTKTLRCTYIKPGNSVAKDTYVIKKTVTNFQAKQNNQQDNWQSIMNHKVWSCSAKNTNGKMTTVKPEDCQWG